jgi:hypothetical protein
VVFGVELFLSKDYKYFKITNRKPNEKIDYILEADPEVVRRATIDEYKLKYQQL